MVWCLSGGRALWRSNFDGKRRSAPPPRLPTTCPAGSSFGQDGRSRLFTLPQCWPLISYRLNGKNQYFTFFGRTFLGCKSQGISFPAFLWNLYWTHIQIVKHFSCPGLFFPLLPPTPSQREVRALRPSLPPPIPSPWRGEQSAIIIHSVDSTVVIICSTLDPACQHGCL